MSAKCNKRLFLFLGVMIVVVIWFSGALSFQYSIYPFSGIFGSTENLEGVFAPVGTFFSAIAAFGALYAIYLQFETFKTQQFENVFFNMLSMHRQNRDSLSVQCEAFVNSDDLVQSNENNRYSGTECFKELFLYYKQIANYGKLNVRGDNDMKYMPPTLEQLCSNIFDESRDEYGDFDLDGRQKLIRVETVFNDYFKYVTSHYYKHLYQTIKYVLKNSPTCDYYGIIRAQLSTYEMLLLYYHGLASEDMLDDSNSKTKFQNLIEESAMLHDINKDLLFDGGQAGSYNPRAFGQSNCD